MDFISVRVITHDVERLATFWERIQGLVPQTIPEIVLEPTDMPWGNRSVILRDPDGGLVTPSPPSRPRQRQNTASQRPLGGCRYHGRHPPTGNAL